MIISTIPIVEACPEGDIRLRGANSASGGRVEICVEQSWTTVCDVFWDNQDASVLCGQLGFSPYGNNTYKLAIARIQM